MTHFSFSFYSTVSRIFNCFLTHLPFTQLNIFASLRRLIEVITFVGFSILVRSYLKFIQNLSS